MVTFEAVTDEITRLNSEPRDSLYFEPAKLPGKLLNEKGYFPDEL